MSRPADRLFVVYANFGSLGHTVVAQNYAALLESAGYAVGQMDVLRTDPGPAVGFLAGLYALTLKWFPSLWRFLYASWSRLPGLEKLRTSWMVRRFQQTSRILRRAQPLVVISTQPLATAIVSKLKTHGQLRSLHVAVLGDWHVQPFWCFPGVDRYVVNTAPQREQLLSLGIPPDRIVVAGHLVAPEYRNARSAEDARNCVGLRNDRPVVLVTGGGRGWGLDEVLRALTGVRTPISAVFLCRGSRRRAELELLRSRLAPGNAEIRLLPFVSDPSPYYHSADLVIGKPSGQGVAQAFACAKPVLAVNPEPGHEEANLRMLSEHGAVLVARPGERLAEAVERLLADEQSLAQAARRGAGLMARDTGNIVLNLIGRAGLCLCLLAPLCGQPPAIRTNGVVNAASQIPSALPGGAIARGALFQIHGVRLGSSALTSVRISSGPRSLRAAVLAVQPGRIDARLPMDAPLGDAALVVAVQGEVSSPFPIRIASANFGIYARNDEGWGPGLIQNIGADSTRSGNRLGNAASPGQAAVLSGTGLGGGSPEVWIGNTRAVIRSVRRGIADRPDEIVFVLPVDTRPGCFVPVQVRLPGALPSNTVTMAARTGGGRCASPEVLPIASWPGRTAGLAILSRTVRSAPDGRRESTRDEAVGVFVSRRNEDDVPGPMLLIPPPGECNTSVRRLDSQPQSPGSAGDSLIAAVPFPGLDAGPRISIIHGNTVLRALPAPGASGFYRALLGEDRGVASVSRRPLFLEPGDLRIEGGGGPDVGRFQVVLPAPRMLQVSNRMALRVIVRARGATVQWQPLSHDSVVLIALVNADSRAAAWGACYCTAAGDAGHFTIPAEYLAHLPETVSELAVAPPSLFLMVFDAAQQRPFQATGLEHALAASVYVEAVTARIQ